MSSAPAIEVRGLGKRYGRQVALESLDLAIPRGALYGLIGPNGAGKSTTFGLIGGWLRPTAGHAMLLGTSSQALHGLRGKVGVMPQDATFPAELSIEAQLLHYARLQGMRGEAARTEVRRVLALVSLDDATGKRGGELSHGMRKRLAFAQALIGEPEVLLLDEPTNGLDPRHAHRMKELLRERAGRTTVLISSHLLADLQAICTHGAILDHGRLVVAGTMDELTGRGREIHFEIGAQGALDAKALALLTELRGPENVRQSGPGHLTILCGPQEEESAVIGLALRGLLDADVPLLGVVRGGSLESAFLERTQVPPGPAPA